MNFRRKFRWLLPLLVAAMLFGCSSSDTETYSLTVRKAGTGSGTVTSDPAGIDCGNTCSASFIEQKTVTLTATADAGSAFAGWSGACTVRMDGAKTVTATFTSETTGTLNLLGTNATGVFDEGAAEISAYDPATRRVFVVNGAEGVIDVLDASRPNAPVRISRIDIKPFGKGANSVAFRAGSAAGAGLTAATTGMLAIAVEGEETGDNGSILLTDADGNLLGEFEAGALPDMVTFTPDGMKVLSANEGEPNDDYSVDPEGSVTIVDLTEGVENATAVTVGFSAFNAQEEALKAAGVRIFGPNATVAQDVEPEYIAVSGDSETAYITLQENNAVAVLDIPGETITAIFPLGFKDQNMRGNGLDASNKDGIINMRNWPVFGMYMPDAIALMEQDGHTYLLTANEGDSRDYDTFSEEERIADLTLDETAFPNAAELQDEKALGRLLVTNTLGDTDGDGDFDALYAFGARSFTIWQVTEGGISMVWDSGDAFERVVAERYPDYFNASNDNNEFDNRSDDKGPEPEGITLGTIGDRTYAFIGLERMGGVMVYDVTTPTQPTFIDYMNNRDFTGDPEAGTAGDLAPEGLLFVPAAESSSGNPMLVLANEVSGTTSLFDIMIQEPGDVVLQILHASDLEGGVEAIERAGNFAAIVDRFDEMVANTLVISAGDNYISGPFNSAAGDGAMRPVFRQVLNNPNAREAGGRADITIMNLIGFQASAFGNHEFDLGTSFIYDVIGTDVRSDTEARWLGVQFPYLSANLDFSQDAGLSGLFTDAVLDYTAFQSPLSRLDMAGDAPKIAASAIVTLNGERFGVVGGTTPRLSIISSPGDTMVKDPGAGTENMDDLATILQPEIDKLTAQGIDKIILTTHLQQIELEQQLITRLHGVDVVIAGGSDTLLADAEDVSRGLHPGDTPAGTYPIVTTNGDGDPAVVVSTDGQYKYVGRLVVTFDADGKIKSDTISEDVSGAFASTADQVSALWGDGETPFAVGTRGHDVMTLTDAVSGIVIQKDSVIYGRTDVYLNGARGDVRTQETNLGNLTADANLAAARALDATVMVSIKNGGGIREPIGAVVEIADGEYTQVPPQENPASGKQTGEVSQLDIENSLKFNNTLTLVTVTAAELLEIMEHAVSATAEGATPGQFPQVGGLSFSFDPALEPGGRVQTLALIDWDGSVVDVIARNGVVAGDPTREIRVVTLNFMAAGGDGYPFDTLGDNVVETGIGEQQALADFLQANYATTPFSAVDAGPASDSRIQNLAYRSDGVLAGLSAFAVFSDPHYYDPDLGTTGSAFEAYLAQDRKMLREGPSILDAAISGILGQGSVRFVIVPGDLTKDGEKSSHEKFAQKLRTLEDAGIAVYVVPGNHDINNPHAHAYDGDTAVPTETVTPEQFAQIYNDYGYGEAAYRDPHSLSYVVEPTPGLWLFALDSADYAENMTTGKPETGGGFTTETLNWITGKLGEARAAGKQVMAMMHHGLIEHYTGQAAEGSMAEDYVIRDWENVSYTLAREGLGLVFTGHFHAQDITEKTWEMDGTTIRLTDVETGSLVTYPSPFRVVTLSPDSAEVGINSQLITEIDYDTGGVPFAQHAETFLVEGLTGSYTALLSAPVDQGGFGLPAEQAQVVAAQIAEALKAHYAGDESPTQTTLDTINAYLQSGDATTQMIGQNLLSLWTDLPPMDAMGQVTVPSGGMGGSDEPGTTYLAFKLVTHHALPGGNVCEIVAASKDGNYLFYTDASAAQIGVVNITDPASPAQIAAIDINTGGAAEPTSIAVSPDGKYAFVAVRRGDDADNPNPGVVQVFDITDPANVVFVDQIGVGVGPDSIAVADTPTESGTQVQIVVAIEDEETNAEGDATLGGTRPGSIQVIKFDAAAPSASTVTTITTALVDGLNLTPGANYPDDPQPEYVAISPDQTKAAVTIQESNAVAIVDIANPDLVALESIFPMGMVERDGSADLTEDGEIQLTETMTGRREADGIAYVPSGNYIATANEGDTEFDQFGGGVYSGGRGFTLFNLDGDVVFDPLAAMEEQAVLHGHYPDERSANRGIEAETVACATFGADDFLFAASERGSFLSVYTVNAGESPEFVQFLPTGTAPEGVLPITDRNDGKMLLVTANEEFGTLTIFQAIETAYTPPATEPMLVSTSTDLPWGALSGLTSDGTYLYAVPDNAFTRSRIYRINMDSAAGMATIDQATFITDQNGAVLELDPEGIAYTGNGFWVASEGATPAENVLYRTDMEGVVQESIPFPETFIDTYAGDMTSHGYEGVDVSSDGRYVYAALQRGFIKGDADARIMRYDTQTGEWITARYPMGANSDPTLWMGISEITLLDDDVTLLVVERDKGTGPTAEIKSVYSVSVTGMTEDMTLTKTLVSDLRWDFNVIQEKVEGMTLHKGEIWGCNDNDGAGWTRLINIGTP